MGGPIIPKLIDMDVQCTLKQSDIRALCDLLISTGGYDDILDKLSQFLNTNKQ